MADGRHGYNVSVGYTSTCFPDLAPSWLDFCMRARGFDPQRTGRTYRYADLGCGTGFHTCVLAAANPEAEFVGIDFDSDIKNGEELAAAAGLTNVTFIQADFLDLAKSWPKELGTFDYLALQGILSWVSPEVRSAVYQCVANASRNGTVASFGYNCWPGWLSFIPFQHLTNQFGKSRDANGAIGGAISMFRRLSDAKSQLFERMPLLRADLQVTAAQPAAYLAHEFLPDHWTPLWHSDVARPMRGFDFTYAGSATVADALLPNSLPPNLASIISEQTDETIREDVQDITVVQRFRRDIFCRNPRRVDQDSLDPDALIFLLNAPKEGARVHFQTSFGGLFVEYGAVADIVAALADGPRPVAALMLLQNPARPNTRSILLSMMDAQMITVGEASPGSTDVAARFNASIARAVASGEQYMQLAAAALGSCAPATELDMLLLDTWLSADGEIASDDLARGVVQRLKALGRQLQFRGNNIPDEQLQSHIARLIPRFIDQLLPWWRGLGVIR